MEPITILKEKDFLFIINNWWEDNKEAVWSFGGDNIVASSAFYISILQPLFKSYEFDLKYNMADDHWIITQKNEED